MASVSYSYNNLNYIIHHDPIEAAEKFAEPTYSPTAGPVQIELTISLQLDCFRHHTSSDLYFELDDEYLFVQESHPFRLRVFTQFYLAYHIIGPVLSSVLQVEPDDFPLFEDCIKDIMRHGLELTKLKSNRGRKLLPLHVEFSGTLVQHVNVNLEGLSFTRALSELDILALADSDINGMVPALESAIKKMVKRVRVDQSEENNGGEISKKKRRVVKGGDNCVICLEELTGGSYVSQMPCFHAFHCDCIEQWLKVGHDCPICGSELPTTSESYS